MVAGDLVNTASRLQSVAPPGAVLVGEATQRAATKAIAFEAAGEQTLKGKAAPGAGVAGPPRRGRGRRPQPRRDARGARSSAATTSCASSRTSSMPRRGRVARASCRSSARPASARPAWPGSSSSTSTAWWSASGTTTAARRPTARASASGPSARWSAAGPACSRPTTRPTTRAKIAATLSEHVPDADERRWIAPALLALLGVESGVPAEQLFGAWRTFFERLAATAPVVLVFEDFHYADSGLIDFVDHLLEWSRNVPHLRRHARAARAARQAARLGCRETQLHLAVPGAAGRVGDARAPRRPRPGPARTGRRRRSSTGPTGSRCMPSRRCACW